MNRDAQEGSGGIKAEMLLVIGVRGRSIGSCEREVEDSIAGDIGAGFRPVTVAGVDAAKFQRGVWFAFLRRGVFPI